MHEYLAVHVYCVCHNNLNFSRKGREMRKLKNILLLCVLCGKIFKMDEYEKTFTASGMKQREMLKNYSLFLLRLLSKNMSRINSPAPSVMAESAMLNAGK